MYQVYTGKQRGIIFPVMCNGHILIDYQANIVDSPAAGSATTSDGATGTDLPYGLWGHKGSFTFESIITPYDINGYGTVGDLRTDGSEFPPKLSEAGDVGIDPSRKIMPAYPKDVTDSSSEREKYQSYDYISNTARLTHEMRLFHNTNFQFSLVNDTPHYENQPAEYKLRATIVHGGTTTTTTTDALILPSTERPYEYRSIVTGGNNLAQTNFNTLGRVGFLKVGTCTGVSGTSVTGVSTGTYKALNGGKKFYIKDGANYVEVGTYSSGTTTITLTSSSSVSITSTTTDLFIPSEKNPTYVDNAIHVACSYNQVDKTIDIYLNRKLIQSATHGYSGTNDFEFTRTDCFIGANGSGATGANSATTNKQYMGEIHEMSIMNLVKSRFSHINNLNPQYDNTLLYLRFEEVDA